MENKFQVGDIVKYCGVEGKITCIDPILPWPITAIFIDPENKDDIEDSFLLDGRSCRWHKEPSLILVRREVRRDLTKKQFMSAILSACYSYKNEGTDIEYHKVSLNRLLKELGFE